MLGFLLLSLFVTSCLSQDVVDPHIDAFVKNIKVQSEGLWTTMDYNGNGVYDRSDLQRLIHDYDSDGDNEVTPAEFEFHFDMSEPTFAIVAKNMFKEYDSNADGLIDTSDLNAMYKRIDHMDHNGVISKEEFVAYYTEILTILYAFQVQELEKQQPA